MVVVWNKGIRFLVRYIRQIKIIDSCILMTNFVIILDPSNIAWVITIGCIEAIPNYRKKLYSQGFRSIHLLLGYD